MKRVLWFVTPEGKLVHGDEQDADVQTIVRWLELKVPFVVVQEARNA